MKSGTRRTNRAGGSARPDPAGYVGLLKAVYPQSRPPNRKPRSLLGGLTGNDYPYLESVYAAGGKGDFDAVGVHTDTSCDILSPYEYLRGTDNRMIRTRSSPTAKCMR